MSYDKLTDKQKLFVDEYLVDLNATQAYLRAGYQVSETVAGVNAHHSLKNPKIAKAIEKRMEDRQKRTEITQEMVIKQLAKIAFADIKDFVEWDKYGNVVVKPASEIDGTLVSEISSSDTETSRQFKFKRNDQLKALELLGKHMKLFTDKVEQENSGSINVNFNIPRPTYKKEQ